MSMHGNRKESVGETVLKIGYNEPDAVKLVSGQLFHWFSSLSPGREIVIVCIGTDRSTGDALGPLVGSRIHALASGHFAVYGTLEHPVHAVNLAQTLESVYTLHYNPFVVGIDACLGQVSSIGQIQMGTGPVKPGAGVNKDLPPVGNIHITGIVNVGGFMEYFVLQNTRLHLVMNMADVIAESLARSAAALSNSAIPSAARDEWHAFLPE